MKCFYCGTEPNNATTKKELKVCCCYRLHKIGNKYEQHYSCKADEEKAKAVSKMPDKKLTDNEKTKALECCISGDCDNCPYDEQTACNEYMKQDALDLINRLQAEKQNLEIELKAMRGAANSYKAENERLKDEYEECKKKKFRFNVCSQNLQSRSIQRVCGKVQGMFSVNSRRF